MISYKLAEQLKDAEWEGLIKICDNKNENHGYCNADKQDCKLSMLGIPTLSKLIEACGEEFYYLTKYIIGSGTYWRAFSMDGNGTNKADTPEEAVAKLWLELNKKDEKKETPHPKTR